MNYIKVVLFIVLFLIVGLAYANQDWNGLEEAHQYIGYLLLVIYIAGSALFVYKPVKGDKKLKRLFFYPVFCGLYCLLLTYWSLFDSQATK
jgi:hypothetical protein